MAESTIPYSFTPGTKAKASEVNANFLALADGLDESREYTKTEVTKLESKLDEKINDITVHEFVVLGAVLAGLIIFGLYPNAILGMLN